MPTRLKVIEMPVPTALAQLVADYLAFCRAKGLSPRTTGNASSHPLAACCCSGAQREEITQPDRSTSRALSRLTSDLLANGGKRGRSPPTRSTPPRVPSTTSSAGLHQRQPRGLLHPQPAGAAGRGAGGADCSAAGSIREDHLRRHYVARSTGPGAERPAKPTLPCY